jgi:hypothetical protein
MNRVLVVLPLAAVLLAAVWPASDAQGAPGGVCEQMSPARLLEHPRLAGAYADALRSGDAGEVARVRQMLGRIRSAHGCEGEVALPAAPEAAPALPPGHPPVAPRLPPGHPPIAPGERPEGTPRFEGPGVVTI